MRRATHHSLRWSAVTALTAAAVLTGSSTALAGTESSPARAGAKAAGENAGSNHGGGSSYRGGQGFNLCLVARCTTGSGPGTGAISQVQGVNLCFLAACSVRS